MAMKKTSKTTPSRSRKKAKGLGSLLRMVRDELRLEKVARAHVEGVVAERDAVLMRERSVFHRDVENLTETIDDLRTNLEDAERRAGSLYERLQAEEIHDREQELNISILLQQILALNGLMSQLQAQLLRRQDKPRC